MGTMYQSIAGVFHVKYTLHDVIFFALFYDCESKFREFILNLFIGVQEILENVSVLQVQVVK